MGRTQSMGQSGADTIQTAQAAVAGVAPPSETVRHRSAPRADPLTGEVRQATPEDVPAIQALIDTFARRNRMLFRSAAELLEYVHEYQVYLEDGALLGVCGLHPVAGGLAEVRGLAVSETTAGRGVGSRLVEGC